MHLIRVLHVTPKAKSKKKKYLKIMFNKKHAFIRLLPQR